MATSTSIVDLQNALRAGRSIRLLDVRRRVDFNAAPEKIPTAEWYDPEQTDTWITEIPTDQELVVYCVKGGAVSQSVADLLEGRQCRVTYLDGGIKAWKAMGGAVA